MQLYIKRSDGNRLPHLRELVALLPGLNWSVLFASGVRRGNALPQEWLQIQHLPQGLTMDEVELSQFDLADDENSDLMEALIIGARNAKDLKRYQSSEIATESCDVVLHLADGDSWLISSKSRKLLESIADACSENYPKFIDQL